MHFLGRWRKIGLIFRTMQMEDLIAHTTVTDSGTEQ
jgi:hypothetical protein